MKITHTILWTIFFVGLSSQALSQDLGKLFFQKNFWLTMNWGEAKASELWLDAGIKESNATENGELLIRHRQKLIIDGKTYMASLVERKNKISNPDFAKLSLLNSKEPPGKLSADECDKARINLDTILASKSTFIDNKYRPNFGPDFYLGNKAWQWEVGPTRITLECVFLGSDKEYASVDVKFEPASDDSKIAQPIFLSCQMESSSAGKDKWMPHPPEIFKVIPKEKAVTNADLYLLADLTSISETQLEITFTGKNRSSKYSISRIDGSLTGNASAQVEQVTYYFNLKGQCEPWKPSDRKF